MSKKCVNCSFELQDNDVFCTECGTRQPEQEKHCIQCGAKLPQGAKFCMECGTPVSGTEKPKDIKKISLEKPSEKESSIAVDPNTLSFNVKGVTFRMKYVQGGMLNEYAELSDFYIGETEVTQELWQTVMGDNPSEDNGDLQYPVTNVSTAMCSTFILKLKKLLGVEFDIPTYSQWKFAYKGGVKSKGYKYSGSNNRNVSGWTQANAGGTIHCVGELLENELGLYDMDGNVAEICKDWFDEEAWDWMYYHFNPVWQLIGERLSSGVGGPDEEEDVLYRYPSKELGLRLVINIPVPAEALSYKKEKEEKSLCEYGVKRRGKLKRPIDFEVDGITYRIDSLYGGNLEAMLYDGQNTKQAHLKIPRELQYLGLNFEVTSIDEDAFEDCKMLTSIIIPDSVTEIDKGAFHGCTNLTGVYYNGTKSRWPKCKRKFDIDTIVHCSNGDIEDEVHNYIFTYDDGTVKHENKILRPWNLISVEITNLVTSIDKHAFSTSGLTQVTIPNSVTEIGWRAFYGCSRLTSIEIPNSVTKIEGSAFDGCTGLTQMSIPDSVTKIGDYAFHGCDEVTIVVPNKRVADLVRASSLPSSARIKIV